MRTDLGEVQEADEGLVESQAHALLQRGRVQTLQAPRERWRPSVQDGQASLGVSGVQA